MSDQRIIENYKGFQIIANYFRNEYQARIRTSGGATYEVRKCSSVKDALNRARSIVDEKRKLDGVREIHGTFDCGYSAAKHIIRSVPTGVNEYGHTTFDTTRTEMGEALFQLKYRDDFTQVRKISDFLSAIVQAKLSDTQLIVPVPPSKYRPRQPVVEIAREVSATTKIPLCESLLNKQRSTPQMKDIATPDEKIRVLEDAMVINLHDVAEGTNILLVDDLYDSGSSLNASANKIRASILRAKIYALTVTRKGS